jgi:hypothetical protein
MTSANRRPIQLLSTFMTLEFFGPALRDIDATHTLNPDWVGHARFHFVWSIAFLVMSGLVNLYLVWRRKPAELPDLAVAAAWQGCNLAAFWGACATAPLYGGRVFVDEMHLRILGVEENALAFIVLSSVWCVTVGLLLREHRKIAPARGGSPVSLGAAALGGKSR